MFCHVPPVFPFCFSDTGPCFRSRPVPAAGVSRGVGPWVSWNVMFCHGRRRRCHVSSWSAGPPAPVSPVRIPHAVPPSHSVRFRSPRRRPGRQAGPYFRAYRARACAGGRARLCAGAVSAPDCARETADARLPSTHAGAFFGPSRSPAQKRQRRPRKPPSLYRHRTTRLPDVKPRNGHNMKLFRYFSGNRARKPGFTRPRRYPATPRR